MSHGIAFLHATLSYHATIYHLNPYDLSCCTRALVQQVQAPTSHMLRTIYTTSHATTYKCKGYKGSHVSAFRPAASTCIPAIPSPCQFGCIHQFVHLLFMLETLFTTGDVFYDLGKSTVFQYCTFHRSIARCIEVWQVTKKHGTLHRSIAHS